MPMPMPRCRCRDFQMAEDNWLTAFSLLHYICCIFHSHYFLVNILLYIVIAFVYISCIKWKGGPKQSLKVSTNFLLFCSLLFCFLILILLNLEIKFYKFKIAVVDKKFTVFNFCRPLFQLCDNRKAVPPPASLLQYNWFISNLQTTHGAIWSS